MMKTTARRALDRAIGLRPIDDVPYATHVPVLIGLAALRPVRRVLEFGSGDFSTLLFLDRQAFPDVEQVVTYEDDMEWADRTVANVGDDRRMEMRRVDSVPDSVPGDLAGFDLILVDDSMTYAGRATTIAAVAAAGVGDAVVVVHDFEHREYWRPAARFRHTVRMNALTPQVAVAWNSAPLARAELRRLNSTVRTERAGRPVTDIAGWAARLHGA